MATNFTVNGKPVSVEAPPETPLLWVVREGLKLTGTKFGCGTGLCGACMVHIDGKRAYSCQTQLSELTEVRFVALTTGAFDLVIEVFLPSVHDYLSFVQEQLSTVPGIKSVETSMVLRKPKSRYNWIEMLKEDRYSREKDNGVVAMPLAGA